MIDAGLQVLVASWRSMKSLKPGPDPVPLEMAVDQPSANC
jgi:hypothetical protein